MSNKTSNSHRLNFRLVHLLYLTALVASALGTFGGPGLALGIPILAFWAYVFTSPQRPRALAKAAIASMILYCFGLLLPAGSAAREAARRAQCSSNLRCITRALDAYHNTYGSLPPAYVADENRRPKHSWRVLILPFLGQKALYKVYNFDEPWDGPNNRKLASRMPPDYVCPSNRKAEANSLARYMAVVGQRTCWPGSRSRKFAEVADGRSTAVILIEVTAKVNWLEPRDVTVQEAIGLLSTPQFEDANYHTHDDFFHQIRIGHQVAFADGQPQYLFVGRPRDAYKAAVTIDDGRSLEDFDDVPSPSVEVKRLRIGDCLRLGLFVVLVLWPLPRVWLHPEGGGAAPREQ